LIANSAVRLPNFVENLIANSPDRLSNFVVNLIENFVVRRLGSFRGGEEID